VLTGAAVLVAQDFRSLAGQRLGLIVNQVSMVGDDHLIDLVADSPVVELAAVFAPEHGVRGSADAGEAVGDSVDGSTGVPVFSLYGATRAPTPAMLGDVDVLVYDLQDVGTRFYTYISTMGLAMQAAARAHVQFVVLDRPDPLGGMTVAGFRRDENQASFVSQYPITSAYGMTAGELATAIKSEGWFDGLADLDLRVVELEGWQRGDRWPATDLAWLAPSPGLPTFEAALVYSGTVLFETTVLSYGKGTSHPFTTIGAAWVDGEAVASRLNGLDLPGVVFDPLVFTPDSALAPNPRSAGIELEGIRYRITDVDAFRPVETGVHVLVAFRDHAIDQGAGPIVDRSAMFNLLAGTFRLLSQLRAGASAGEIIDSWADDVRVFEAVRQPYLRY
jgi:uncharacterized protein YbbC (DUF1343 family)